MKAKKTPSQWGAVKNSLSVSNPKKLLELIHALYDQSEENRRFIQTRFLAGDDQLDSFKRIINQALYPDVYKGKDVSLAVGRKAINDYRKATSDETGVLDLMIYYVECGNDFTLDIGDINEQFYSSLESMFDAALKWLKKSDKATVDRFLPRMRTIVEKANGMGWGYYDYIADALEEAFPKKRMIGNE
jgi:hypothetical protein